MSSNHLEVRKLLIALAGKVGTCQERLDEQAVGNALYGLQVIPLPYRHSVIVPLRSSSLSFPLSSPLFSPLYHLSIVVSPLLCLHCCVSISPGIIPKYSNYFKHAIFTPLSRLTH